MEIHQTAAIGGAPDRVTWREFLRAGSMSAGVYLIPAGVADPQNPHNEDEAYFVIAGRGGFEINGESQPVEPGTFLFVPARAPHRFHSVVEDLRLLVLFAPPEGSR
jgi:mannose-6-phosphate isomerase-like protein (cupin superfamily)